MEATLRVDELIRRDRLAMAMLSSMLARKPLLVWGPPGVGKTAKARWLARRLGFAYLEWIGGIMEPTEVRWPRPAEEGLEFLPQREVVRFAREAEERGGGLFVIDELTNNSPDMQAALLRIVHDKMVGDFQLDPERVAVIGLANPPDMAANPNDLAPPMSNRFTHVAVGVDAELASVRDVPQIVIRSTDWAEQFVTYWGEPPAVRFARFEVPEEVWQSCRIEVAAFIRFRPNLLLSLPRDAEAANYAWPSPRSWDMASRGMAVAKLLGDQELMLDEVARAVGVSAALEFMSYRDSLDIPDPDRWLDDPAAFKRRLPDRLDKLFAFLMSLAAHVRSKRTERRWRNYWETIGQAADISQDIVVPSIRMVKDMIDLRDLPKELDKILELLKELMSVTYDYDRKVR